MGQANSNPSTPLAPCPTCGLVAAQPVYKLVGLRYSLDHMKCTNPSCRSYEP